MAANLAQVPDTSRPALVSAGTGHQYSPLYPHLTRTPAHSTLWEATALSGQPSVLETEFIGFMFSSFFWNGF